MKISEEDKEKVKSKISALYHEMGKKVPFSDETDINNFEEGEKMAKTQPTALARKHGKVWEDSDEDKKRDKAKQAEYDRAGKGKYEDSEEDNADDSKEQERLNKEAEDLEKEKDGKEEDRKHSADVETVSFEEHEALKKQVFDLNEKISFEADGKKSLRDSRTKAS